MGYDFRAAVADLIDNSIEADAQNVWVQAQFDGDDSWVMIADDGCGMEAETLVAAMRYGSEREYSPDDLGKFGLGMKVASMSQCRRLTVASRSDREHASIHACRWDLEHIEREDAWELIRLHKADCHPEILALLKGHSGTVVMWERLDRILGYKYPYGEAARKYLLTLMRDLEHHLAMVFHRFLSGEVLDRKLNIYINGNGVAPWDPFARSETHTETFERDIIEVITEREDGEDVLGVIKVEPYVLPHQARFSSMKAFNNAAGPNKWNRQQGFYIYRSNRLIQSGGWSGFRTSDEHTKLARVALSFTPELDAEFKINVAKMKVQLPSHLKETLGNSLKPVIRAAQVEYRNGARKAEAGGLANPPLPPPQSPVRPTLPLAGTRPVTEAGTSGAANGSQQNVNGDVKTSTEQVWTLAELEERLLSVANDYERGVLRKVFSRLRGRGG